MIKKNFLYKVVNASDLDKKFQHTVSVHRASTHAPGMTTMNGSMVSPPLSRTSAKSGAGVADLVNALSRGANSWATKYGLQRMIEKREFQGQIESMMGPKENSGVLIVARYQEWAQRDFTGAKAKAPLTVFTVGNGVDWQEVLARFLNTPTLSQGAPKGWVGKDLYVWVTKWRNPHWRGPEDGDDSL